MKLASYKDGSRDGQLVVVSRDLGLAHYATGIATRLQQVLDDWNYLAPLLQDLSETLNHGKARHAFAFEPQLSMAPLPRVFGRTLAGAWPNRRALHAKAAGRELPADLKVNPQTRLVPGDWGVGACDDMLFPGAWGRPEVAAGLTAVVADLPAGVAPDMALEGVRLLMLSADWSVCTGADSDSSMVPFSSHWAPVAVTLDELGSCWQRGRLHAKLRMRCQEQDWGEIDCAEGMHFHFGQLIADAARLRPLRCGSSVSAGPVSSDREGLACASWQERLDRLQLARLARAPVAEPPLTNPQVPGRRRKLPLPSPDPLPLPELAPGEAPVLRDGDRLHLEVLGSDGMTVFGAIEQTLLMHADDA